jgi:hypothetical protein
MSLSERLTAIDDWLLDRVFQPVADRLGERLSAFDLGLSLQLGAVVFDLAADAALFAAGLLGVGDGIYDGLSCAGGVWFYALVAKQRPLVGQGRPNPLRVLYRSLRLLALGLTAWSLLSGAASDAAGALSDGLSALSALAFVAGMYFISCQPRLPGWRRTVASRVRSTADGLA